MFLVLVITALFAALFFGDAGAFVLPSALQLLPSKQAFSAAPQDMRHPNMAELAGRSFALWGKGGEGFDVEKSTPPEKQEELQQQSQQAPDSTFERQELAVIFDTMEKNDVYFAGLGPDQKQAILEYVSLICSSESPVAPNTLASGDALVGRWRLEFSNESRYAFLPPGADVLIYIYDAGKTGRLDNIIQFWKSWSVKTLRTVADFELNRDGKVLYTFRKLTSDLFGLNIPFPVPKGPGNFVDVNYFDGRFWIESLYEGEGEAQRQAYNVYRRLGDIDESDKNKVRPRNK